MNLKYYLRGLGIGIIVTAIIMGIAADNNKETLNDTQIRERAAELGMIEEKTVLKDLVKTPEPSAQVTPETTGTPEDTPDAAPVKLPEKTPEALPSQSPEQIPVKTPKEEHSEESEQTPEKVSGEVKDSAAGQQGDSGITIEVKSGEGSGAVSKKLEDAGAISNASEFDQFLCKMGYDKKITVGTHVIPAGSDQEEIAGVLSGK